MAQRAWVDKEKNLRSCTDEELNYRLRSLNTDLSWVVTRRDKIQALCEASYPVVEFPKVRGNSVRGIVLGSFVTRDGIPTEGSRKDEVVKRLLDLGKCETKEEAEKAYDLYKWNLVRYYGFHLELQSDTLTWKAVKRK